MRFRTLLPALMIFTVAFVATLFSAWSQRETLIAVGRDRFEVEGHALAGNIVSVMGTYANVLRSGVGLFDAKGEVMPDEFARFVKALNLEEEFPGIQGLGFSAVTNRSLHDGGTLDAPAGHIETAIRYLLPGDWRNQRAIGFDMYGEITRQVAMARARDTGEASLSGKVTLVQEVDADTQAGTLLYVPVYASPGVPDTVEERRRSLRGYVYAAFRMSDLMTRSLTAKNAEAFNNMRLQLFDGKEAVAPAQLYDSREILSTGERARVEKLPPPIFMASLPLPIAGEPWLAQMSSREPFEQKLDWSRPSVQLIGGLIISVLLAAIAASLAFARERSQQAAQLLMAEVADRKKAQEQAQLANRELIHRVKNTLAIVNAIASQTARHTRNMNEFTRAFRERLGALGRVHDLLRPDRPGNPDLRHLIMEV
ncbi:MAG: CHASE domain-containing protein, partial [Beijerinckiaceae bacterium]